MLSFSIYRYKHLLHIADDIFKKCVQLFALLYDSTVCTMNVHLLYHVVDDCRMYGPLYEFSGYKFENHLASIKRLLRSGRNPLAQAANRICELQAKEIKYQKNDTTYPILKKQKENKFEEISIADGFKLNTSAKNQWFKTKAGEVVCFKYATMEPYAIYGCAVKNLKNFFDFPFGSDKLHIHLSNKFLHRCRSYQIDEIMLKMVGSDNGEEYVFIPLNHTLDMFL